MTGFSTKAVCMFGFCLALQANAHPERESANDIMITAQKSGDAVLVSVNFTVPANAEEVWKVLTDFDHIAQFVSNVQSSKVVSTYDGKCRVSQAGRAARGPLSFAFDSVQEFELKPFEEIRSRLISGSMKKLDGVTQLIPRGSETSIVYHGVSIPDVWVPPLVGTQFIEAELRDQYREIRNEIMRRKRLKAD